MDAFTPVMMVDMVSTVVMPGHKDKNPECQSPFSDPFLGSRLAFGGPRSLQKTSKRLKVRRPARTPVPVHTAMVPCSSAGPHSHGTVLQCHRTQPWFRVPVPCPAAMVPAPEPAHTAMVPAPEPAHTAMVQASVPAPAAMFPAPFPLESPLEFLLKFPLESPLKFPLESLLEFLLKFPLESPLKFPLKSPLKPSLESLSKSLLKSPLKSPLESLSKSLLESPLKSPLKFPLESPFKETLAGTARRSIQKDTHESITMSVAGKYVCSRKKKM
ncbi:hypothetical protein F7725_007537 [Dissostichus mawsoni]|uniref:Uncharacterized protein n=1 Tax=Dissostichus mawsoni TaxID=36200 RepID=A0A7J5Y4N5_DISMA|nr:hypothetical protein F7725_007537 [Dissostichus mawsoni]